MKNLPKLLSSLTLLIFIIVSTVGAFSGGVWAVAAIAGAVLLFAGTWIVDKKVPRPSTDLVMMACAALVVMVSSNLFSVYPSMSWVEWGRLTTIFIPLMLYSSASLQSRGDHVKLFHWLPLLAALGAAALGDELYFKGPILHHFKGPFAALQQYNRGLSYLVVLSFPILAAMLMTKRKKYISGLQPLIASLSFIIVLLFPASLTESRAAKLALIVGLAVVGLAYFWPRLTCACLGAFSVVCVGWPFAAQWFFLTHYDWLKHFPDSWRARMEIWDYMSYRIMEHPWLGWGLGTSHMLDFQNPHGAQYVFTKVAASHPHDAFVQLWVEMGLPGLVLGIAFALVTLRKASQCDRRLVPFAFGAWAASLCLALVAYSLWTDSLFAAFALTGCAFALLERQLEKPAN